MAMNWSSHFAERTHRMEASAIRELLKVVARPEVISFAGGIPANESLPVRAVAEAIDQIMAKNPVHALQYGTTDGYAPLREQIAALHRQRGIPATAENILLTTGSQQGLDLIGKCFINEGSEVIVEKPTYVGALQAWRPMAPKFIGAQQDDDGILLDSIPANDAHLIYLLPNFQNPSGISMSLERRKAALEYANQHNIIIVEDDPYRELRYSGEDRPALIEFEAEMLGSRWNDEGQIIYLGTFSKTLAPGLRIGWVLAPTSVIHMFNLAKQGTDLHSSTLSMLVVSELIANKTLEKNIGFVRELYKERRDTMLDALTEMVGIRGKWTQPEGGLFVWMTLPGETDTPGLLVEALKHNVAFVPGDAFYYDHTGKDTLRLNFSVTPPDVIVEGVRRLSNLIIERQANLAVKPY
jgi:2-aminoadipate transaminase